MKPAETILDAADSHRLIERLTEQDPSLDEAGAYAIAWDVHARRRERGERPVGRKIGFTNRSIWAEYGVWAPIWGHGYDSTGRHAPDGRGDLANRAPLPPRVRP